MNPRSVDASISILARSPGLMPQTVEAVVTVPTFRRPDQILATLRSLKAQETARRCAVIVIENDAERREAAKAAAPLFESGELDGMLIVAHERGNCSAYNAGWQTALVHFPAFRHLLVIDDDELADPHWLERLCSTAEKLGADIVGGPQIPVFADPSHSKWAEHPVFAPPYRSSGMVPKLYSSGNLLVGRHVLQRMGSPFLDLRFNFMGGGDSDFLSRAADAGFRQGWCAEASVRETVPARRIEREWIRSRSLRNGVISTLVEKRHRAGQRFGNAHVLGKSLLLAAVAPLRGLKILAATGSASRAIYPLYVAAGRLAAEFGYSNEQYRQPEKN